MKISQKSRALKYADLGLYVVPLHTIVNGHCSCGSGVDCPRPGKHPRTRHGVNDATTDRDQINAWWAEWPDANVGIAPGRDRNLLVLDIDPRHGGNKRLKRLTRKLGALPDTVIAKTGGGGRHLFFKHPSFKVRKDNAGKLLGRGIDVLSDGYVIRSRPTRRVLLKIMSRGADISTPCREFTQTLMDVLAEYAVSPGIRWSARKGCRRRQ
jgi:Bifunctional DNA primase/polymerase, N-terminal